MQLETTQLQQLFSTIYFPGHKRGGVCYLALFFLSVRRENFSFAVVSSVSAAVDLNVEFDS